MILEESRYYIRAVGMELAVNINRTEENFTDHCDLCGKAARNELDCMVVNCEVDDIERAEYWLGEVPEKMKARIASDIRKALSHGKSLCRRCYRTTWAVFERKFVAEETFGSGDD
jgi:hypothetical protein